MDGEDRSGGPQVVRPFLCVAALATLLVAPVSSAAAAGPVASPIALTTGNGHGFGVWQGTRLVAFFDQPFRYPSEGVETDNMVGADGVAFGVRSVGEERGLIEQPVRSAGYVDDSHVIAVTQRHGSLRTTTYVVAPWSADRGELALLLEVTNTARRPERHGAVWLAGVAHGPRWELADLGVGETRWVGVRLTPGGHEEIEAPQALLEQELTAWEAWRVPPPPGLSPMERRVWRQSESVLRMAQVRAPAPAGGAILASLPPGMWWIAWVRDMAYAVAALAQAGHAVEARAGVEFWVGAEAGRYREYVGVDYPVSVTRYFGDGGEESDFNEDGPNIEFDGFGLAIWAAHVAGSDALDGGADTLISLIDPDTGLVSADSSIWEVHWNGRQKRFAYTSIVAARGMCDAGRPDDARSLRDAIVRHLVADDGGLAQSYEELTGGLGSVDAAVLEAINFGLVDPGGALANATVERLRATLTPPHGAGLMRNDDGGGYDRQEWVFIGLRLAVALRRMGRSDEADAVLDRFTLYADANHGLHAELLHESAATYRGAVPMVGFGAGAWQLAIVARQQLPDSPHLAACFGGGP